MQPRTRKRRTIRAAATAMGGFALSLFAIIALLLPTPQAGAGLSNSTFEEPCVSIQPPCPPGQPDEQMPHFSGTIAALERHNGRIDPLAPADALRRSVGHPGRNIYLRFHRLLL